MIPTPVSGRRSLFVGCCRLAALLWANALFAQGAMVLDVPYVPTPQPVVDRMLELAEVRSGDFVMDVGCGDGRMVVTAARDHKARGLGIDINPQRIKEARLNAEQAGVTDKVEFRVGNLFEADLGQADVLAMYLLPRINLELRPKILATMKPGTRVVSHAFSMGDWKPDRLASVGGATVYLWIVPARVEGRWRVRQSQGGKGFDLDLKQAFQELSGSATIKGRTVPIRDGRLRGSDISFAIETEPGRTRTFRGRVNGEAIEVGSEGGPAWLATRGRR